MSVEKDILGFVDFRSQKGRSAAVGMNALHKAPVRFADSAAEQLRAQDQGSDRPPAWSWGQSPTGPPAARRHPIACTDASGASGGQDKPQVTRRSPRPARCAQQASSAPFRKRREPASLARAQSAPARPSRPYRGRVPSRTWPNALWRRPPRSPRPRSRRGSSTSHPTPRPTRLTPMPALPTSVSMAPMTISPAGAATRTKWPIFSAGTDTKTADHRYLSAARPGARRTRCSSAVFFLAAPVRAFAGTRHLFKQQAPAAPSARLQRHTPAAGINCDRAKKFSQIVGGTRAEPKKSAARQPCDLA